MPERLALDHTCVRFSLTVMPSIQKSVNCRSILLMIVMDMSTLYAIDGIITLSSSCPACTASATVVS